MDADAIVIGAGIGGLSAAIRLAAGGKRVIVLERGTAVGGKMAEHVEAGFRWDTGPSVLTMRQVVADLFTAAGRRLEDYLDLLPVDPLTRYFYPDGTRLDLSRDLVHTLDQITALDARDREGYLSFLAYAARLDRLTSPVFTFGPPPTLSRAGEIPPGEIPWVGSQALLSMDSAIRARVHSPHLRQLFGRFATYVGSSPYRASALLSVIAHVELNEGIWYPRGGIYTLARALERLAGELKVDIRTGSEVSAILCARAGKDDLRASGVRLAGGAELTADTLIANLDVAGVYQKLLPRLPLLRRRYEQLNRMEPSCSGFVLLAGVDGQQDALAHHNLFFSSDYRREFRQIFVHGQPPDDPTIYVSISSKTDPGHAPTGGENWFVLVNAPSADGRFDWQARKEAYADLVLQRLAERGIGLGRRLRLRRVITPPDLERMNGARRGALYGVSFNDRLAAVKRPGNRCREVEGLFFVGGTTHPGGGVPLVMLSGKVVADMVLGVE